MMRNLRKYNEIRKLKAEPDFCPGAYSSLLFQMGNTKVICAVSISDDVPEFAKKRGTGWLSAEYTMLPYSTTPRSRREFQKRDGRSVEIQRLIGRSLRGAIDLSLIENYSLIVDCDVLQADGGTRTASITGAYIALKQAVNRMVKEELIKVNPIVTNVAAISAGYVGEELLIDLDYSEDSKADVDMNIVMDGNYDLIEIQGTGENRTFTLDQLNNMLELARKGIKELIDFQNRVL